MARIDAGISGNTYDTYLDSNGVLHDGSTKFSSTDYAIPGLPEYMYGPESKTKIEAAWRASYQCGRIIGSLLENGQPFMPEEVRDIIIPIAQKAVESNRAVAKRNRACEKCIVGYLGYCPFSTGQVGTGESAVALTSRMASDLVGTANMSTDTEDPDEPKLIERPPLDDELDVSVPDIMDGIHTVISNGRSDRKARSENIDTDRQRIAKQHFAEWEKEILEGRTTATIATQLAVDVRLEESVELTSASA